MTQTNRHNLAVGAMLISAVAYAIAAVSAVRMSVSFFTAIIVASVPLGVLLFLLRRLGWLCEGDMKTLEKTPRRVVDAVGLLPILVLFAIGVWIPIGNALLGVLAAAVLCLTVILRAAAASLARRRLPSSR